MKRKYKLPSILVLGSYMVLDGMYPFHLTIRDWAGWELSRVESISCAAWPTKCYLITPPPYLAADFIEKSDITDRFVRRGYRELVVPFSSTNAMQKSFLVSATRSWNGLPDDIKRAVTFAVFKNLLFKHLFDVQCSDLLLAWIAMHMSRCAPHSYLYFTFVYYFILFLFFRLFFLYFLVL